MNVLLETIKEQVKYKKIASLCDKLMKKCSFSAVKDMELLLELILWLYIANEKKLALSLCSLVSDVEFTGNYNVWTFIHHIQGVWMQILLENGEQEQAQAIARKISDQLLLPDGVFNTTEKKRNFEMSRRSRFDYAGVSRRDKIAFYEEQGDVKGADQMRFTALYAMMLYPQLEGFTALEPHMDSIQADVKSYVERLRSIMK